MAPCQDNDPTGVLNENDLEVDTKNVDYGIKPRRYNYVWRNIILYVYLHVVSIYGIYLVFTSAKLLTTIQGKLHFILFNI